MIATDVGNSRYGESTIVHLDTCVFRPLTLTRPDFLFSQFAGYSVVKTQNAAQGENRCTYSYRPMAPVVLLDQGSLSKERAPYVAGRSCPGLGTDII